MSSKRAPIDNLKRLQSKPRRSLLPNFSARQLNEEPYIVKIKNIISDEEIEEIMKMGKHKFERSNLMVDGQLVYNDTRTSSTAYIVRDGLPDTYSEPVERFIERIQYLAGCKREQIEMMMVKYTYLQKFDKHVDYFEDHEVNVLDFAGNRKFTFFIYLNTLHEGDGGETEFTQLGIRSKPRRGDGLFWHNQNPKTGKMMPMTEHQGNPVLNKEVIKYGVNVWVRSEKFY